MRLIDEIIRPTKKLDLVVWDAIQMLNIRVTKSTLIKELSEHPNYPSMLAISDTFSKYDVGNIAVRLKFEDVDQLPVPFLAHVSGDDPHSNYFILVKKMDERNIFANFDGRSKSYSMDEFMKVYKGTVLIFEAGNTCEEENYNKNRAAERRTLLLDQLVPIAFIVVMLSLIIHQFIESGASYLRQIFYLIFTLAGVSISAIIIIHEIDEYNPIVRRMCQQGKKVNCSAVLSSNGAKIWGISWGVIGFSYFLGILLIQIILGFANPLIFMVLSVLSTFVVLYIPYSIYYQWKLVKQWCFLCLIIQSILIIQFAISIPTLLQINLLPTESFVFGIGLPILIVMGVSFLFARLITESLKNAKQGQYRNQELKNFKYDPEVVQLYLSRSTGYVGQTADLGIFIGAESPKHKIIKVCNPFCGPCSSSHKIIDSLIKRSPEIQVQIIFTATGDKNDFRTPPVRHFLALAAKKDPVLLENALDTWYSMTVKDYELFAGQFPLPESELAQCYETIEKMASWCAINQINATPTFYVNNKMLPHNYSVNDLFFIL